MPTSSSHSLDGDTFQGNSALQVCKLQPLPACRLPPAIGPSLHTSLTPSCPPRQSLAGGLFQTLICRSQSLNSHPHLCPHQHQHRKEHEAAATLDPQHVPLPESSVNRPHACSLSSLSKAASVGICDVFPSMPPDKNTICRKERKRTCLLWGRAQGGSCAWEKKNDAIRGSQTLAGSPETLQMTTADCGAGVQEHKGHGALLPCQRQLPIVSCLPQS